MSDNGQYEMNSLCEFSNILMKGLILLRIFTTVFFHFKMVIVHIKILYFFLLRVEDDACTGTNTETGLKFLSERYY